jgi:hypothetical protein
MVKDRFPPDDHVPLFLSNFAEGPEQLGIRKAASSQFSRKAVLVFAAAAVVFAVGSVGNVILFAGVTASEVRTPAPRDGSDHFAPAIQPTASQSTVGQSTANAEALPRTPPGDELLAAFKSALENKAEVDPPKPEALLNQFQAWATEEAAQAPARPVQDVRTPVVHNPPLPRRRPNHAELTARAQDPSPQNAPLMRHFGWRN